MPAWLGALAQQVGGTAAQGAMGILAQRIGKNYDRKQWIKDFEVQSPRQMGLEKQMMEWEQANQMEMWHDTNYGAQIEEMKKAGVNPALLYGGGGGGGTTVGNITGNAPQIRGTSTGTGNGVIPPMGILTAAQIKLMEAQARNLNVQSDKTAGVDTQKAQTEIQSLTAGIENTKAQTRLKEVETNIATIDQWIKDKSKQDVVDQIMWVSEKTMNEMNNLWREGLLTAAQFQDKVNLLKTELAGKIIENEYTQQKTTESKSNVEINKAEIQKKTAEILQGWEKLSQSEKIMKVEALAKEYELLYKGAFGNWRLANPEITTKQIDKVMGLEQKKN